jgi:hypothetical protein
MAISTRTAEQLCNKSEFSLFAASSSNNVKHLSEKEIKSAISRSRKLRDKYRAVASRQEREARGKQEPRRSRPSQGSAATRKKEQLFAESLGRFEKQLEKLDAASKKSAKKATSSKATKKTPAKRTPAKKKVARTQRKKKAAAPTRPATKVTPKRSVKKTSATKKATAKATKARLQAGGKMRKQKHASAENRRQQSRRDAR